MNRIDELFEYHPASSCIHFDIGERSFIADKASWLSRKENGFIYALESGARGV